MSQLRERLARPHAGMLALVAVFLALRLPFLFAGYGADTDAYRVILAGRYLHATGEYLPSRLPGTPLHDLLTSLLLWGGPFLTNLSTTITALLGLFAFDRIVRVLALPGRPWPLAAMAFTPWLVVTSTATLDYHFALAAMLGAYAVIVAPPSPGTSISPRQAALAGLLLGIAGGFRPTALAFALPLALLLLRRDGRHRALMPLAVLGAVSALVAAAAFLPVWWTYGADFWNYADSRVSPDVIIRMVGQWALGAVGALVTLAVLALSWRRLLALPGLAVRDPHVLMWLTAIVIYAIAYLRLPVDLGYLVPIYPFAFLLLARVLARWALPVIVSAAVLSGVIDLDIQALHNFDAGIAAREVRPSWRVAGFAHDYRSRTRWQRYAERILAAAVPEQSVVLTGGAFPNVAVLGWDRLRYEIVERDTSAVSMISDNGALWDDGRRAVYLAVSEPHIIDRFRAEGYAIYRAEPVGPDWQVRLVPLPAP